MQTNLMMPKNLIYKYNLNHYNRIINLHIYIIIKRKKSLKINPH